MRISALQVSSKIAREQAFGRLENLVPSLSSLFFPQTESLFTGYLPDTQCGFRSNGGIANMIFAPRQFQEKCEKQQCILFVTVVDLTKAFDTVNIDGLWKIMKKFAIGCPIRIITIVRRQDG